MKSKDELDKSIVSIEYVIVKNMVSQALGKMNREFTDKEIGCLITVD